MSIYKFDDRQHATVTAALRHWQQLRVPEAEPEWDIATDGGIDPLSDDEIDVLIENHLNTGGLEFGEAVAHLASTKDDQDGRYVSAAREIWADDECEIDDEPMVSPGADEGAWVSAWVWVTNEEAGIKHCEVCGAELDEETSVDGFCAGCADEDVQDPWHIGELPGDEGLVVRDENGLEVARYPTQAEALETVQANHAKLGIDDDE